MTSSLKNRRRKEKWFQRMGLLCLCLALLFLGGIMGKILYTGYPAFFRTEIATESEQLDLLNPHARYFLNANRKWITASDDVDMYYKHELAGKLMPDQIKIIDSLKKKGQIRIVFNTGFFAHSDSREPELAGIWGGLLGSLLTLFITFLTAFPIGIGTALYLEEFAPKNRLTHWIEANINNLAAVPSILFGLLGLVFFIHIMGLPRPSALVGGLTLGLMSLPVIVVATRASLSTVPPTLKEAALGLGATPLQVLFHHVVPMAMPGIITGVILALARALGETAPLLMIGMVAFIATPPSGFLDPATVLPVQIFNWSRSPEMGFVENTSGAILVLLFVLALLNGVAILIRKKFES
ncbi:MAG TPA: phosphate ABC transporter permease PstA [Alphaproteobacteria bacterium]|nr:phosphate ABC transporter permease PstA [Alphaproteobacteria bacterium]